jgi:hypothetical protein
MRLAMLDVDFDVHEPPELVERLGALGRRLSSAVAAPSKRPVPPAGD